MDTRILLATKLARMGIDDDKIVQVLRIVESTKAEAPAPAPAAAAARDASHDVATKPSAAIVATPVKYDRRSRAYLPLFERIRQHCQINGPTQDTALGFCQRFPAEFKGSRAAFAPPENARGFAQVIQRHSGVFGGVRFTKVPSLPERPGRGGATCMYRAEVA